MSDLASVNSVFLRADLTKQAAVAQGIAAIVTAGDGSELTDRRIDDANLLTVLAIDRKK
jgi:hypothetical protein